MRIALMARRASLTVNAASVESGGCLRLAAACRPSDRKRSWFRSWIGSRPAISAARSSSECRCARRGLRRGPAEHLGTRNGALR